MKSVWMKNVNNKQGVTVIELIVTIVLILIVLAIIWLMFLTSTAIYDKTAKKVDAQSQFRLFMDVLEKEIGYAEKVDLVNINPDSPPDPSTNYYYIYIKNGTKDNAVYITSSGPNSEELSPPAPLPGFSVKFEPDPEKPTKIIKVTVSADDTQDYVGSILLQNTTIDETGTSYNSIYYKEY